MTFCSCDDIGVVVAVVVAVVVFVLVLVLVRVRVRACVGVLVLLGKVADARELLWALEDLRRVYAVPRMVGS